MDNKNYITLTDYLNKIGKTISENYPSSEWVRCEISNINVSRGHYYIEVVDVDEKGNKTRNQTAIIYSRNKRNTLDKFKYITGEDLKKGMKVLFKLQASFSAKFSFSLMIEDIDPSFTLGEMEIKKAQIRKEIEKKGYQLLNRNLQSPFHFTNIAVISPDKAAGLADFMAESEILRRNNVCNFDYFPAIFEGDNAQKSIVEAFKKVDKKISEENIIYDAVVFIRGGGSKLSLDNLNEYLISICVCRTKVPVFVGVGHEPDRVLADEYAHYSFDTPSKVIEYITNVIFNNYSRTLENVNQIEYIVSSSLEKATKKVELNSEQINSKVLSILSESKNNMLLNIEKINNNVIQILDYLKNQAKNNLIQIENLTVNEFKQKENLTNKNIDFILNKLSNELLLKKKEFEGNTKEIKNLSIHETLKRGYAIIKNKNKVITSIESLKNLDKITIILNDGEIELNIKEKRDDK